MYSQTLKSLGRMNQSTQLQALRFLQHLSKKSYEDIEGTQKRSRVSCHLS